MDYRYDEGFALYFLLILITISSIFILVLVKGVLVNSEISENFANRKRAFYSADAAIVYSKLILKENNGIPNNLETGENYDVGNIYTSKDLYGDQNFKLKLYKVKNDTKKYKVEGIGVYKNTECIIIATYDSDFKLVDYKVIQWKEN